MSVLRSESRNDERNNATDTGLLSEMRSNRNISRDGRETSIGDVRQMEQEEIMSCSLWRWTKDCEGQPCPGDCDVCGKEEEDEVDSNE